MKPSYISITDKFCGAGGSSSGAVKAGQKYGGVELRLALNHWDRAIETHSANFPNADHHCTDVSASDPRWYPSTNILLASPECTNHSLAKGKKQVKAQLDLFKKGVLDPSAERSRATMWDVPRFSEYHKYDIIIVENVVDARKWIQFPAWLHAMTLLGYSYECKYINSMHCHPTPQSRDRMYIVFWRKGIKRPDLNFTPKAHCHNCSHDVDALQNWKSTQKKWGKYKQQYIFICPNCYKEVEPYYHAAFNAIDWSIPGTRIGDRTKPLSPNTIRRIKHGLEKYGGQGILLHAAYGAEARGVVRPMNAPAFTQTTYNTMAMALPFIMKGEHTGHQGYVKDVLSPVQTQTVRQSMALVVPYIIEMKGKSLSRSSLDPCHTQTSKSSLGIVMPEAWNTFIGYYYGKDQASHISEAMGTATTRDRHFVVSAPSAKVEDCFYRMLRGHEVKKAMAFDDSYIITGNQKDIVKQCGNAVTPPVMEWLTDRCIQSLL